IFAVADIMSEDGKAGRTGSPGENTCDGCHNSFALNSGPGSIRISSPDLINSDYVPGQSYQVTVTIAQTGVTLFGFAFEALTNSNNLNAGTLTVTEPSHTQIKSAIVSGKSRKNMVHTKNGGLSQDSMAFNFQWIAPATDMGSITFYAIANASNKDGDTTGDYIYSTTQLVTPAGPMTISELKNTASIN